MRSTADAAYARGQNQAIQNCTADEQILKAPVHNTGTPGVGYPVVFDFDSDFKIALDSIYGENIDFFSFHSTDPCNYFKSGDQTSARLDTRLSRF